MIKKALIQQKSVLTGWLATAGAILGVLILCLSVQFYYDILGVLTSNKEIIRSDFIPVHKKLGKGFMAYSAPAFSQQDIDEMRKQPFSKDVGIINQGLFKVSGSLSPDEGLPGMYTELFFESLDDKYIDVDSENWNWEAGSHEVPVILPASYLEMYNFGMAPSQNLPVLNEKTIRQFKFNLNITGKSGSTAMSGRIAGFSSRINTILVPHNFLQWANERYGYKSRGQIVHVIWEVEDVSDPRLEAFLRNNNYETNSELLSGNRAKTVLNLVLAIFLLLGSVMVALALMVFVLYNRLLIARKEYNLRVLFSMGYSLNQLLAVYLRRYFLLVLIISGFSVAGLVMGQQMVSVYFEKYYVEHEAGVYGMTWLVFGISITLLVVINVISLLRQLNRIARQPGAFNS
jgi:hypothetical protein